MYRVLLSLGMACALLPFIPRHAMAQAGEPPAPPAYDLNHVLEPAPTRPSALPPVETIGLQQALDLALAASPELSAARHESDAVAATIRQAGLIPNPSVSMGIEDTRRDTRTSTLEISQPIELGGKRAARVTAATRAHEAAQAELLGRQADVRAAVITAFFTVLHAQERLELAEASLDIARRGSEIAGKRVKAGKVSPVEETRARIAEAGVRLEANQAAGELAVARRKLAATWGRGQPHFARADGRMTALPELPALATMEAQLDASPAMQRARAEVQRWEAVSDLEKRKRTPDLTVSFGVQREAELGRNQGLIGVSIPLPLFDRNQGNLLEALRRTDKARDELQAASLRLDGDLAQAHERLNQARIQAGTLEREVLPAAQSAYDAAAKGFEFGKFDFLDVLDAQRTLLQARSQYLRALAEAHTAAAEIERLLGSAAPSPIPASPHGDAIPHSAGR
ncbi:outer membrane protein CzcC [Oxalicibacterium flavum]|uniref:Outer membrane protein CzcC n=1 Tax=Oxalicibacterium flavum TaxID=179467 RepID=A0A8J2UK53_9BURK|nr:TolC family protein [Oxalicibacterium flavum]GGC01366.1 outer membrane protein CzcC [Oxalicibacterium flavum]